TPDACTGTVGADGVCRQTTGFSCGAAAAATMLHGLGVPATERQMAALCWTNAFTGTDEFAACRGLSKRLGDAKGRIRLVRAGPADIERLRRPAMATIRYALFIDHWVVVFGTAGGFVEVGDPLRGRVLVPKEEFFRDWRNLLVVAEPPDGAAGQATR
ncbi:MAG: cysteine peptidase family C39 domain-containing protein, partial [Planctomycetota bacterium]